MTDNIKKVVIGNLPFLLSDTVGFIRKLPTQLVESFKSTLDEVQEADLLLHIVDISHPNFQDHIESVNQILHDIKSLDKPTLTIFNKIDAYKPEPWDPDDLILKKTKKNFTIKELEASWVSQSNDRNVFISALNKDNFKKFREETYKVVRDIHITRFPYNNFLYPEGLDEY